MNEPAIACIGAGAMGTSIIEGCARAGVLSPASWVAVEPDATKRDALGALGVGVVESCAALGPLLGPSTQILLAVKPQSLAAVSRDAGPLGAGRVVISILAGTPIARLAREFPGARLIRAMPNTPARIGQGCTALSCAPDVGPTDQALARAIFGALGPVVEQIDESLMDAFTAVAGSGPAYVFYLAQAMTRAAVEVGLEAGVADRVVRQVLLGSAGLLAESPGQSAAALRAAVTSKGGTTEAAAAVLDQAGVLESFVSAIAAARDRGRALSQA